LSATILMEKHNCTKKLTTMKCSPCSKQNFQDKKKDCYSPSKQKA
jgi:hypothetical protein